MNVVRQTGAGEEITYTIALSAEDMFSWAQDICAETPGSKDKRVNSVEP